MDPGVEMDSGVGMGFLFHPAKASTQLSRALICIFAEAGYTWYLEMVHETVERALQETGCEQVGGYDVWKT